MSALIIMFVCGYFFHLFYKLLDRGFLFLIDSLRKKKNKEVL